MIPVPTINGRGGQLPDTRNIEDGKGGWLPIYPLRCVGTFSLLQHVGASNLEILFATMPTYIGGSIARFKA